MPQWKPRRAVRRHTRSWRSSWLRRSSSERTAPAPTAPAAATVKAASGTALRISTSLLGAGPGRLLLGRGLMLEAEARRGHGLEALLGNGLAVELARAVGAVVEAPQGVLDVGQLGVDLLEDRQVLLALERLGADVGLVLVDVGQLADGLVLGLVGEVLVVEAGPHLLQTGPLGLEPLLGRVRIHGGS